MNFHSKLNPTKTTDKSFQNNQKALSLGHLGPFYTILGKYEFLSKIHSSKFSLILVKHYSAKFQKKLMNGFSDSYTQMDGWRDRWTNRHTQESINS